MADHDHPMCQDILGYLSDFVDGDLNPEFCVLIQQHLDECQNCTIVVDTLRKTISLYHKTASEPAEVPSVVRERLFRTLNLDDYLHH
jgi:predicted anti-sigma-YlaC factor YlaD